MATWTQATRSGDATLTFETVLNRALVDVGEQFGLYSALATIGPATAEQCSRRTGISESVLGHWLKDQAEAGYLTYDRDTARFSPWCEIERN